MSKRKKIKEESKVESIELTYRDIVDILSPMGGGLKKILELPISIKDNKALIPVRNEVNRFKDEFEPQQKLLRKEVDDKFPIPDAPKKKDGETKKEKEQREKKMQKRTEKKVRNEEEFNKKMTELLKEKIDFNVADPRPQISGTNLERALAREQRLCEARMKELDKKGESEAVIPVMFGTAELAELEKVIEITD
jgi:hypothetical protein